MMARRETPEECNASGTTISAEGENIPLAPPPKGKKRTISEGDQQEKEHPDAPASKKSSSLTHGNTGLTGGIAATNSMTAQPPIGFTEALRNAAKSVADKARDTFFQRRESWVKKLNRLKNREIKLILILKTNIGAAVLSKDNP